jgi:hypothetical protein
VTAITGIARVRASARRCCSAFDPVHPRQLDIHEDQGGRRRLGQAEPILSRLGLHRAVAVKLEDVTFQLPVLLVVLDDEDQLTRHERPASVKVKVDPRLSSLSTQIRPPCSSTNFLPGSARPRALLLAGLVVTHLAELLEDGRLVLGGDADASYILSAHRGESPGPVCAATRAPKNALMLSPTPPLTVPP